MDGTRDPFHVLSLPYDAGPDDVRRAFRRLARQTHPDRGGSAQAFHEIRVAYRALYTDLEGERHRWRAKPASPRRAPTYAADLDPRVYPTCTVRTNRAPDGTPKATYDADSRPRGWRPGAHPPPGGTCVARYAATAAAPAFGIWRVPLDADRFRCVFGPYPHTG